MNLLRGIARLILVAALMTVLPAIVRADEPASAVPDPESKLSALALLADADPNAALKEIESIRADRALDAPARIGVLVASSIAHGRLGDNDRALADGQEAERLFKDSTLPDRHELKAFSLFANARANENLGQAAEALSLYYDAWSIFRDLGDNAGMALAHTGGARIYNEIGQHDRALANYRIALGRAEKAGDLFQRVRIQNNIAFTLNRLGRPDEALEVLDAADPLAEELGNTILNAYLTDNRGDAYLELGRIEEAKRYLELSLELGRAADVAPLISGALHDLARLYFTIGDKDAASDLAAQALALVERNGERGRKRDVLALLAEINADAGNYQDSYLQLKESFAIRDDIADSDVKQLAAVLEAQSSLERKEQEIALLQRDQQISGLQLERERTIRNGGIIGIIALLFLVIILTRLLKDRALATQQAEARSQELLAIQKKLEAANRTKSDILAMTSHEVRTPLNGIMGMTQVLMRADLDPEQKGQVSTIHQSAEILLSLLNDILDMSKIEAGRLDIARDAFDLSRLLDGVRDLWLSRAADKGLSLRLRADADLPRRVSGDAGRIRQILNNLISNAIKFTQQGDVLIEVGAADGGFIAFSVTDSGIGISDADRARIFEPFMQAQTGATREYDGSGLGLAICRNLVSLMGGEIGFESEAGKGSTFRFRLPLPEASVEVEDAKAPSGNNRRPLPAGAGAPKILIAEDNEMNRIVMREMLRNQGYDLSFAANGAEAVAAVQATAFDLVMMDIHMPVMGGMEAVASIRALGPEWRRLTVIAITADAMEGDRQRILESGMDDYISKPIDRLAMLAMLERYLGQPRTTAARASVGMA